MSGKDTTDRVLMFASALRAQLEPHFAADTASGRWDASLPSTGHCCVASYIARAHIGGVFYSTRADRGISHWFFRSMCAGREVYVDLTGDQFGHAAVRVEPDLYPNVKRRRRDSEITPETRRRAWLLAERAGITL